MESDPPSSSGDSAAQNISSEEWEASPYVIKWLVLLLEDVFPTFLKQSNSSFKEDQPFVHCLFIILLTAFTFIISFYFLHKWLFCHLAGYYPILQVLFHNKPPSLHTPTSKQRGRTTRPSPTSYRGSKFSTARTVGKTAAPPSPGAL